MLYSIPITLFATLKQLKRESEKLQLDFISSMLCFSNVILSSSSPCGNTPFAHDTAL
jgi:hypothetical protein